MKSTIGSRLPEDANSERKYVSLHTKPPASSFHLIFEMPSRWFSMKFLGTFVSRIDFPGDTLPEESLLPELSAIFI